MCKLNLEKAGEPEIKLPTSIGSQKKQENSRKIYTAALLTKSKPFTVWITTNYGKFFKGWEYQTCLTCLLRNLYAGREATVRTRHGTIDWFQIGKGVCILSPCLFNLCMQSISCEMLGGIMLKLASRLPGEISITSDMQMTTLLWQKVKRNSKAS